MASFSGLAQQTKKKERLLLVYCQIGVILMVTGHTVGFLLLLKSRNHF